MQDVFMLFGKVIVSILYKRIYMEDTYKLNKE